MSIYKRYFDKSKCMYFVINDEIFFDKYTNILENVSSILRKINSELIIIKNI